MERNVGTVSRGIRCPIFREGDDVATIVCDSLLRAAKTDNFELRDRDVVAITESIVARCQGNYATCDDIAQDIRNKFPSGECGIIFPILSRNRFAMCLKGFARGLKKITLMLSYPRDEVGNELLTLDQLDAYEIDPYVRLMTLDEYRGMFGENRHPFTGVDYVAYYSEIIRNEGCDVEIIFSNRPQDILKYTENVLTCDIHSRQRTKRLIKKACPEAVIYGMDDVLRAPVNGSGHNENYGLLGSNKATEDSVKLFPNDCQPVVDEVQRQLLERTGKHVEVMIYGDGAFKDPVGQIWELADPVVSPGCTPGLIGTPNELKLKFLADNDFADLSGEELRRSIEERIRQKDADLVGKMESEGTTPRRLTDLIGSLCDLTSGSGDKGTPVILVQGYFDNYTN